jgi:hypothetical protein
MSTSKGRSMRSKVEKRMAKETGRTQRELRRAVKLRKKLMTEDERLIHSMRRVSAVSPRFPSPLTPIPAQAKCSPLSCGDGACGISP